MAKADKALAARRVEDILRLLLDGARWRDIREYVRAKEAGPGSAWSLTNGKRPLSATQIRSYQARANELLARSGERSREKLFRTHLAMRGHLYARAVASGDYRTAPACLQDEARMLGLYPPVGPTGEGSFNQVKAEPVRIIFNPASRPDPKVIMSQIDGQAAVEARRLEGVFPQLQGMAMLFELHRPLFFNRTAQALGSWSPSLKTMAHRSSFFRSTEASQERTCDSRATGRTRSPQM